MKKHLLSCLLVLFLIISLGGCTGETLDQSKNKGIDEIENYVYLSLYPPTSVTIIESIIAQAIEDINQASKKIEITEIIKEAKAQIDLVITKKDLSDYQSQAITLINQYLVGKTYSSTNDEIVKDLLKDTISLIIKANSIVEIDEIVDNFKAEVDQIPQLVDEIEGVVIINDQYKAAKGEILTHSTSQKTIFVDYIGLLSYTQDTKVYQYLGEELILKTINDLYLGMQNLYYYINRQTSKIDYIIINGDVNSDNIKVFINRSTAITGDNDRYHDTITLSSSANFSIRSASTSEKTVIASNQTITITNQEGQVLVKQGNTILLENEMVIVEPDGAKITVTSINRGQGKPSYYGRFEITCVGSNLQLVNNVLLEDYLKTVVPSEMPTSWNLEAIKAQAICARTYALSDMLNQRYAMDGYHVDDSVMSQVYNNSSENARSNQAILETKGLVMKSGNSYVSAVFFSTGSGATGLPGDAWFDGTTPKPDSSGPYHSTFYAFDELGNPLSIDINNEASMLAFYKRIKIDSYDRDSVYQRWHYSDTFDNITKQMKNNLPSRYSAKPNQVLTLNQGVFKSLAIPSDIGTVTNLIPVSRGEGGLITCLEIVTTKYTFRVYGEYNIRMLFRDITIGTAKATDSTYSSRSFSFLPSAYFACEIIGNTIHLYGGGWGHGTGMSQYGANNMASRGYQYNEILHFYYNNFDLVTWINQGEPNFDIKAIFNLINR